MRTLIYSKRFDVPFGLHTALLAHCTTGFRTKLYETPSEFRLAVRRGGFDFAFFDLTQRGPLSERVMSYLDALAECSNGQIALLLEPAQTENLVGLDSYFRVMRYPVVNSEWVDALKVPMACARARNNRCSQPASSHLSLA